MFKLKIQLILLFLVLIMLFGCSSRQSETLYENVIYNDNYVYHYYVPTTYSEDQSYPLFVILHGGTQKALDIMKTSMMNEYAETYGFIVLYPEKIQSETMNNYWGWFLPSNQLRDQGESKIITDMVYDLIENYTINDDEIYIAGFSAGGAMAYNLQILYPDIFSGVAVAAGLGYATANSVTDANIALFGVLKPMDVIGPMAATEYSKMTQRPFKTLIFHGDKDTRVDIKQAYHIKDQSLFVLDYLDDGLQNESAWTLSSSLAIQMENGRTYQETVYMSLNPEIEQPLVKLYIIDGLAHLWSGGSSLGTYADPETLNMSEVMIKYFLDR